MKPNMDLNVKQKFDSYPRNAQFLFTIIRNAIYDIAQAENLGEVEETLKWGEPSYSTKNSSAVRIAWKAKNPNQISIYFNCKTTLVETFKELFGNVFIYQGNREIIFPLASEISIPELKICISLSLRYHKIKHLPMLGVT